MGFFQLLLGSFQYFPGSKKVCNLPDSFPPPSHRQAFMSCGASRDEPLVSRAPPGTFSSLNNLQTSNSPAAFPRPKPGWGLTLPLLLLIAISSLPQLTSSGILGFKEKGLKISAVGSRRPLPSSNRAMGWFCSLWVFPLGVNAVPPCPSLPAWPIFCFLEVSLCSRLGLLGRFPAAGVLVMLRFPTSLGKISGD